MTHPVPAKNMEERVENHIKQLHAQLQITPAEQPQWDQFAQVMRENARDVDQAFMQRAQQYPTMNAMQNMQSYEQMAEAHVQHLQKPVPAFDNLYNAMPEQQKKLTDQVFRANAARHAAQSRHGTNATANSSRRAQAHRLRESARALTPSLADIAATGELFFDLSQLVPVLGVAAAS